MRIVKLFVLIFIMFYTIACDVNDITNVNLYGIELENLSVSVNEAYFLGVDGTLYCTGVNTDAASFVSYLDKDERIVAKNVKSFGGILNGAYYIDRLNNLYIYNQYSVPYYNYLDKKEHTLLLSNVLFADFYKDSFIYLNNENELFLVGRFNDAIYHIDSPMKIASNVKIASNGEGGIVWVDKNNIINGYGNIDEKTIQKLNNQFAFSEITSIEYSRDYIALISKDQLWLYGDKVVLSENFVNDQTTDTKELRLLHDNIESISCSTRTLLALDKDGNGYIWGRCVSNTAKSDSDAIFTYYNGDKIFSGAISIHVSDGTVGYIDSYGKSCVYYVSNLKELYGNSTDNEVMGVNGFPSTWIFSE